MFNLRLPTVGELDPPPPPPQPTRRAKAAKDKKRAKTFFFIDISCKLITHTAYYIAKVSLKSTVLD